MEQTTFETFSVSRTWRSRPVCPYASRRTTGLVMDSSSSIAAWMPKHRKIAAYCLLGRELFTKESRK